MTDRKSPFLYPGDLATADSLAIIHLKRDLQVPVILRDHDDDNEGYSEGKVINTRFGSFPHTTLIGLPWGSQVRASIVDTGSRGRRGQAQEKKKRKREPPKIEDAPYKLPKLEEGGVGEEDVGSPATTTNGDVEALAASSGFVHLLPPTPENWTSSLPHRTQVVYTPDYSYILHRLRARPGTTIIEAGAGSGSFTHAAVRAVFHGFPRAEELNDPSSRRRKLGKVWSFEFHEQRHEKLVKEIQEHGLEDIVQITHRDVCADGFLIRDERHTAVAESSEIGDGAAVNTSGNLSTQKSAAASTTLNASMTSPSAEAVFLDLPAPWLALPHLVRSKPLSYTSSEPFVSPLCPTSSIHLCTFSPCIEQVQRTISCMRHLGWIDIEMVELSQKRFEIRRERIGIDNGAQRGLQQTPSSVEEAVARLIEVEGTFKSFHQNGDKSARKKVKGDKVNPNSRQAIIESLIERKVYKEGRLVHRTEPEVKSHTSYLVFAVLPMEWSEKDERAAQETWPIVAKSVGGIDELDSRTPKSKKQMKREARAAHQSVRETVESELANDVGFVEPMDHENFNPDKEVYMSVLSQNREDQN